MEMSDYIETYSFVSQGYQQEALLNKVSASVKYGGSLRIDRRGTELHVVLLMSGLLH